MASKKKKAPSSNTNSERGPGAKSHFSDEQRQQFVKLWTTSNSAIEVAEAMGIQMGSCNALATRLRKAGVKLKKFKRVSNLNVEALNEIIAKNAD
jgi:transposase